MRIPVRVLLAALGAGLLAAAVLWAAGLLFPAGAAVPVLSVA